MQVIQKYIKMKIITEITQPRDQPQTFFPPSWFSRQKWEFFPLENSPLVDVFLCYTYAYLIILMTTWCQFHDINVIHPLLRTFSLLLFFLATTNNALRFAFMCTFVCLSQNYFQFVLPPEVCGSVSCHIPENPVLSFFNSLLMDLNVILDIYLISSEMNPFPCFDWPFIFQMWWSAVCDLGWFFSSSFSYRTAFTEGGLKPLLSSSGLHYLEASGLCINKLTFPVNLGRGTGAVLPPGNSWQHLRHFCHNWERV